MTNNGLSALYDALTQDPGPHLAEETLAELATAEAAGEDIEILYPNEVRHIETCVACAEAYGELVEMMLAAVDDMAERAAAVKSVEVYAALLARQVAGQTGVSPRLSTLIQDVTARLPAYFTALPQSEAEITPDLVDALLAESGQPSQEIANIKTALLRGIRRTLSAVSIYLTNAAEEAWGRAVGLEQKLEGTWRSIQLFLLPEAAVPTLGGKESGQRWPLFSHQIDGPLPFHVAAWAKRLSTVDCRVHIQIDQPGLAEVSGIPVQLSYAGRTWTAETDASGVVIFESIPAAIIPDLRIRFQG